MNETTSSRSATSSKEKARRPARGSTTVDVEIFGSVYHVRGEHDPEYLQELADRVDATMREIARHVSTVETGKIAILAALNLADELAQNTTNQEGERVQIMAKVAEMTGELTKALHPRVADSADATDDHRRVSVSPAVGR